MGLLLRRYPVTGMELSIPFWLLIVGLSITVGVVIAKGILTLQILFLKLFPLDFFQQIRKITLMRTMLNNFINGNLKEAKRQARSFTVYQIARALHDMYGVSVTKARLSAFYLRNPSQTAYQLACDAK